MFAFESDKDRVKLESKIEDSSTPTTEKLRCFELLFKYCFDDVFLNAIESQDISNKGRLMITRDDCNKKIEKHSSHIQGEVSFLEDVKKQKNIAIDSILNEEVNKGDYTEAEIIRAADRLTSRDHKKLLDNISSLRKTLITCCELSKNIAISDEDKTKLTELEGVYTKYDELLVEIKDKYSKKKQGSFKNK